mgnify:CR=1 FL=1
MTLVTRQCLWCASDMATTRSSKKLCSKTCHSQFNRWADNINLTNIQGYERLVSLLTDGRSPNRNHPINRIDLAAAEYWNSKTKLLKAVAEFSKFPGATQTIDEVVQLLQP